MYLKSFKNFFYLMNYVGVLGHRVPVHHGAVPHGGEVRGPLLRLLHVQARLYAVSFHR